MTLALTWLGHSTVVLDFDGVRLISDPLLLRHAGVLRRRGPAPHPDTWRGAHGVLLSHLHHDHAELRSLRLLGGAPVITATANARWLSRKKIAGAVGLDEHTWHPVRGAVDVRLTTALHGDRPMPHRPNASNGHLVRSPSLNVWLAGDTERHPGLSDLPHLAGGRVDVAVVPVSGWGPRLSGGHLDPVEAAHACAAVGAKYAVPVHWGTLHAPAGRYFPRGWMDRAGAAFARAVREHAPRCEPVVLQPGGSWRFGNTKRRPVVGQQDATPPKLPIG